MLDSDSHFRKQHLDPLHISAIQGHSGAKHQPNFFSQKVFEQGFAKELYHTGLAQQRLTIILYSADLQERTAAVNYPQRLATTQTRHDTTGQDKAHAKTRHRMEGCDTTRHDTTRHDTTRHATICHDTFCVTCSQHNVT